MTPNEPPTPPRKASWKWWAAALACVLAIITVALLLKAPTPGPVSIWFVRSTNVNGVKTLVFQGTNRTSGLMYYAAYITTNLTASSFPGLSPDASQYPSSGIVSAGESFTFTFVAPLKEPAWRVAWRFAEPKAVPTRWDNIR